MSSSPSYAESPTWNAACLRALRLFAGCAVLCAAVATTACAKASSGSGKSSTLRIVVDSADRDADVFVDGAYLGQVSEVSDAQTLTPGTHRVEVRKAGRFPVQRTVVVDPKSPRAVTEVAAELLEDLR